MASQNISPSCKYLIGVAAAATLSLLSSPASAQALYRSIGQDGRITFSDRAPVAATGKASVERRLEASSVPAATLPYELREVASRYPVTLYTAADCAPCASARALLAGRGVPFTERTVTGTEDIAALKALSGDGSLPFAMLGSQQLRMGSPSRNGSATSTQPAIRRPRCCRPTGRRPWLPRSHLACRRSKWHRKRLPRRAPPTQRRAALLRTAQAAATIPVIRPGSGSDIAFSAAVQGPTVQKFKRGR